MGLIASLWVSGCATPPAAGKGIGASQTTWRGRLAVQVEADPEHSRAQSFTAGFELSGHAQEGALTLLTPLGSTAAHLSWSEGAAVLRANNEHRQFSSLDLLIANTVGTDVPVAALFEWLAGHDVTEKGWRADLSQFDTGRIIAKRRLPQPAAELKLILEK